ncbi:MAG: UDP-glucose 4-epimerase [Planctomycetota bacterium]|jgi:UDP-glucose 4-epimerase
MRVLITGGAGFIGSHLAERLLNDGHQVTVLDDLSTGCADNLAPVRDNPNFKLQVGSCLDEPLVIELVDQADYTVHLAAAVGVKLIVEKPVHTIETNVRATEVVLSAAAKKQKRVLIASTSEVYGKSEKVPFHEDDDISLGATNRSRWAYACSKALDEWLAFAYHAEQQVPVVVVRFFNTVGPRQTGRYGMVLPNFVQQALEGKDITVFGDGKQARCFGHVHDAVEAVTRLMAAEDAVGRVFNVGSTEEISMYQLAERVRDKVGSNSDIKLIPYSEAYAEGFEDMPRRIPDVNRLFNTIGFKPERTLDEIIADVIQDQKSQLERGA